jgi:hypothetical protein
VAGRSLTAAEMAETEELFGRSVDTSRVRITRDDFLSFYAPKVVGNTVHLRADWGLFRGEGLELSQRGQSVLVHELVHVWQYQNGGVAYIGGSLWAQSLAILSAGGRGAAYRWQVPMGRGLPWERWNPEQQAQAIQDLWDAQLRLRVQASRPGDDERVAMLTPLLAELRAGRGAPRIFGPPSG